MLSQTSAQHVLICAALHKRTAGPAAAEAARSAFVEAMCAEATSDLLCWSMRRRSAKVPHKHSRCMRALLPY